MLQLIITILIFLLYFPKILKINKYETKHSKAPHKPIIDFEVAEFNRWLDEMGVYRVPSFEMRTIAPSIRAVYATEDIPAYTEIVKIPLHAMIYDDTMDDDPEILKAKKYLPSNPLLSYIIFKDMNSPHPRFQAYYNMFPKDLSNFPLYYNEEDMKYVDSEYFREYLAGYFVKVNNHYAKFTTNLPELANFTKADFYKFYTYVCSRSLSLNIQGKNKVFMIPLFDMFNTYPYAKYNSPKIHEILVQSNVKTPYLLMSTTSAIKDGEEMLTLYRTDYTNTQFLLNYGFVFYNTCDVTLQVSMNYTADDSYITQKEEIFKNIPGVTIANGSVKTTIDDSTTELSYKSTYAIANILEIKDIDQLNAILKHIKEDKNANNLVFNPENQKRAMKRLMLVVENKLTTYNHTLEEDKKEIEKHQLYTNPRSLIHVSMCEKKALYRIIDYAKSLIQTK